MAQAITCDICSAEPAAQLITNLADGATLGLGANCLPGFYASYAVQMDTELVRQLLDAATTAQPSEEAAMAEEAAEAALEAEATHDAAADAAELAGEVAP